MDISYSVATGDFKELSIKQRVLKNLGNVSEGKMQRTHIRMQCLPIFKHFKKKTVLNLV